ncbi:SDR family NAD(P)-dependent oxidoreductase [Streptomyces sp. RLB1-33]|uniref:SDR family NAD(P)-dependent oxidoreductase n=1 Tax=Streptomyces mirabilis TaxID=68239 RepID=UPI002001E320|nr:MULTISPECIES: SDR family NAD(P)-dependent oxidoreductase [Streptomyces]
MLRSRQYRSAVPSSPCSRWSRGSRWLTPPWCSPGAATAWYCQSPRRGGLCPTARAARTASTRRPHVDILINNARITQPAKPVEELTGPDLQRVYDTNVLGPVRTLHAFLPLLRKAEHPVVVNVGSSLDSIIVATAAAGADAPSGAFVENGGTLPW